MDLDSAVPDQRENVTRSETVVCGAARKEKLSAGPRRERKVLSVATSDLIRTRDRLAGAGAATRSVRPSTPSRKRLKLSGATPVSY